MRRVLPLLSVLLFLGGMRWPRFLEPCAESYHRSAASSVTNAQVTLQARKSAYTQTVQTDGEGEFHFDAVPLGEYSS